MAQATAPILELHLNSGPLRVRLTAGIGGTADPCRPAVDRRDPSTGLALIVVASIKLAVLHHWLCSPKTRSQLLEEVVGSQHHRSFSIDWPVEELTRCSLLNHIAQPLKLI